MKGQVLVLALALAFVKGDTTTRDTSTSESTTSRSSIAATTTAAFVNRDKICDDSAVLDDYTLTTKKSLIQSTFQRKDFKRPLDLIFIVDRSQSIGEFEFQKTINTIEILLTTFAELRYIYVHKSYTRVAVVSFADQATVNVNGLSENSPIDACVVNEQVNRLTVKSYLGESKIMEAMQRAQELFSQSRREEGREDVDQVVWLFNDGECSNPNNCTGYTSAINAMSKQLRDEDVTIYASGIGQWLDDDAKVVNLESIATSAEHFACANTWLQVFSSMNSSSSVVSDDTTRDADYSDYSEITDVYKSRCSPCDKGFDCACYVIDRTYKCTDKLKVPINITAPPVIVIPGEVPAWLLPVAIGSSVAGGILLIILLIVVPVLCVRKKKAKEEEKRFFENQPIYGGPILPPPPIRRKPRMDFSDADNVYANRTDNTYNKYPESEMDKEYMAIPYPQDYVNEDVKLDHDMPDWPGTLSSIKQSNHLLHLALRSVSMGRWAHTAGCKLGEKDFRELEKVMRQNKYTPHMKIKVAAKTYEVDKENLSNIQIHGTRFIQKGLKEVLWALKVFDYVIVGIAHQTEDWGCVRAVHEIHRHLLSSIRSDPYNIKGLENVEEDIYSCVLPERYSKINEGFDPPE